MKTIRTILPKNQGIFFDFQKKEGKTSFLLHASAFMFLGIHAPVSNAVCHSYSSSSNCGSLLIIFCSPCTSSDNNCRSIGLPSNNTNPKFLLLIQIIHSYWNNYDLLVPFSISLLVQWIIMRENLNFYFGCLFASTVYFLYFILKSSLLASWWSMICQPLQFSFWSSRISCLIGAAFSIVPCNKHYLHSILISCYIRLSVSFDSSCSSCLS